MPRRPDKAFLTQLRRAAGADAVLTAAADTLTYGYDNSRRQARPDAVVFARDEAQIAAVVTLCAQAEVPLVCRGLGSGTTGAAVPLAGGVILAMERMDRIVTIDTANRALIAQPGATNAAIQAAAAEHGFFWPPDPTSAAYSTLGGNLACNSAGPHAVKYGTPRDNILGLRAVTGTGQIIRTGVYTTKGVVGYDLTRLIVGSEGSLAVITEATLKLTPIQEARCSLRAVYADMAAAAAAVSRIMAQPATPCVLEFIDAAAIGMIRGYADADLPADAGAMLLIEIDGPGTAMDYLVDAVTDAADGPGLLEVRAARDDDERAALWASRRALSPALRKIAPKKINEDVVVPVSRMAELIEGLRELGERHDVTIVNFGHAGNGNIHVNLLVDPANAVQMRHAEACLAEIFSLVLRLGGTLSGEHGIGFDKREFVGLELEPAVLELMRGIKAQFDPKGILNPGKLFPTGHASDVGPAH